MFLVISGKEPMVESSSLICRQASSGSVLFYRDVDSIFFPPVPFSSNAPPTPPAKLSHFGTLCTNEAQHNLKKLKLKIRVLSKYSGFLHPSFWVSFFNSWVALLSQVWFAQEKIMEAAAQTQGNGNYCEAQSLTPSSHFPKHFKFPGLPKSSPCLHLTL